MNRAQSSVFGVVEYCHFLSDVSQDNAALKKQVKTLCGVDTRRMSRLTLLALAGVAQMRHLPRSNIYLASSFSSPQTFDRLFHAWHTNDVPKPFDFIANINNAAAFRTAGWLRSDGNALFLAASRAVSSSWAQPVLCALSDLMLGRCTHALVGWAHEYQPQQDICPQEGSHWLLLSADQVDAAETLCGMMPATQLASTWNAGAADYYWQDIIEFFARLERGEPVRLAMDFSRHIVFATAALSSSLFALL